MRNNFVIPELELKKQKLESIRSMNKPINRREISEHMKKHDKDLKIKVQQK